MGRISITAHPFLSETSNERDRQQYEKKHQSVHHHTLNMGRSSITAHLSETSNERDRQQYEKKHQSVHHHTLNMGRSSITAHLSETSI